jgi:hypothetical protein
MKALIGSLSRRDIFVLDALRVSLLNEKLAYARLLRSLAVIARLPLGARPTNARACTSLATAWQLVDEVHRIRGLVRQVYGLPHRTPAVQIFLRETAGVEQFRNFFQHLNSSIGSLSGKSFPIIGVLSWSTSDSRHSCSLAFGHWTKETHAHSLVWDMQTMSFIQSLQFDAADLSLAMGNVHARARSFSRFFERWLRKEKLVDERDVASSLMRFGVDLGST